MDFEHIWTLLHLLWIVPLFGILVYYASFRRKKILKKIFGDNSDDTQYSTLSRGGRYLRMWLLLTAILLLVVAVARPRWGWRLLPFSGRGRDLMLVLDVSKSMGSEDVKPTRLKHAKLFLRDLIKATPGDRYGLVAFAGSAFLDCPLTVDKTSLFQTLNETNTSSIPLGGTNIENALNTAITAFKAAEGGYRAIILVTDGDELYGNSSKAIATLKAMKTPLFVVGIGDPTGDGLIKMTGSDGKIVLMRDSKGELIKSRLNETQLKKLARDTGGIYVRSTETDPGFKPIYKRIKNLVPKEYEKGNNKRPIERFHYPLFAAILLLFVYFGIGERRKINGNAALVILMVFLANSSLQAQNKSATAPGSPLAVEEPIPVNEEKKGTEHDGMTAVELYNKALELQKANKIEEAAKLYREAINMSGDFPEVRGKAFQNLGVIVHAQGREKMTQDPDKALQVFNKTEEMYRESMRTDTHLKKVILNQQRLIDDRVLAKQIKKRQEELKKKQQQAQKKTKEALDQKKKDNQDKKKQKKDKKKDQQKQNKQQKQQSKNNKQNKQQKNKQAQEQKKQDQNKNQQQKQNQQKKQNDDRKQQQDQQKQRQNKKTGQKIDDAQKAVEELKKEAQKHNKKDVGQSAGQAEKELKKAKKEHKKGNGEKSEEHLRKALEKLKQSDEKNKNKNSEKRGKTGKDQDKKAEKNKKDDQKEQKNDKNRKLQKHKPADKSKSQDGQEKKEKEIDPAQAAALLEMMANDEKNLRDAIKENQKKNARIRKVLKDW